MKSAVAAARVAATSIVMVVSLSTPPAIGDDPARVIRGEAVVVDPAGRWSRTDGRAPLTHEPLEPGGGLHPELDVVGVRPLQSAVVQEDEVTTLQPPWVLEMLDPAVLRLQIRGVRDGDVERGSDRVGRRP